MTLVPSQPLPPSESEIVSPPELTRSFSNESTSSDDSSEGCHTPVDKPAALPLVSIVEDDELEDPFADFTWAGSGAPTVREVPVFAIETTYVPAKPKRSRPGSALRFAEDDEVQLFLKDEAPAAIGRITTVEMFVKIRETERVNLKRSNAIGKTKGSYIKRTYVSKKYIRERLSGESHP